MNRALTICMVLAGLAGLILAAEDSCRDCHSALEGPLQAPAALFANDVHARRGFGCAVCHGGDPRTDDPELSMGRARGFRGKIARTEVPRLCAHCHSDAAFMHKFNPKQRVDQYAQYVTSVHGRRIAAGDSAAANCADCHSLHDIREVRHSLSPVHPLKLPATCGHCHSDAARMAKYGIPVTQFDEYRKSVHWEALEKRGDLSAPSCASCHGNHGATPPGVDSVAAVCGTCHVLMEDLFRKSPHEPVFAAMGLGGCAACHGNHAVLKPSTEMLAGQQSTCGGCHEPASAGGKTAAEMAGLIGKLSAALNRSETILNRASSSGMEVSEAALRLNDGREALVKARVAVHAAETRAVATPVSDGLKIATETFAAGELALRERNRRRIGLGVSLLAIVVTLIGLRLAIRTIEKPTVSMGR